MFPIKQKPVNWFALQKKKMFKKMQQIYRRTPMSKCDSNKDVKQSFFLRLLWQYWWKLIQMIDEDNY